MKAMQHPDKLLFQPRNIPAGIRMVPQERERSRESRDQEDVKTLFVPNALACARRVVLPDPLFRTNAPAFPHLTPSVVYVLFPSVPLL